ncbi:hypothetical protein CMUS01_03938 [Colletotrichum musicola]|uniref:Uncharacterized protein n=1 Tax=Colletotrichum musicola TaxID=2175873 RepID=A0A8H6U4R0_9PEZI|nr:hypothetical protein CMUS01_03938 [Colletotrichum musicola]
MLALAAVLGTGGCGGSRRPDWTSKREGARLYGSTPRHRCEMGHWHAVAHWLRSPRWKGALGDETTITAECLRCVMDTDPDQPEEPAGTRGYPASRPGLKPDGIRQHLRAGRCWCPPHDVLVPLLVLPATAVVSVPAAPACFCAVTAALDQSTLHCARYLRVLLMRYDASLKTLDQVGKPRPASDDLESQRSFRHPSLAIPHPAQNLQRLQWLQAVSVGTACNGQGTFHVPGDDEVVHPPSTSVHYTAVVTMRVASQYGAKHRRPSLGFATLLHLPHVPSVTVAFLRSRYDIDGSSITTTRRSVLLRFAFPPRGDFVTVLPSQSQAGEEIAVKDEKYRTLHLPGHRASLQYKHMLRGLPPYLRADQHDPDDEGDHVPMQRAIQKPSTILSDSEGNGVASTASSLSNEADV